MFLPHASIREVNAAVFGRWPACYGLELGENVEAGEMVYEAAQWSGKEKLGFEEWKMAMNQTPLHAREQPTADRDGGAEEE